MSNLTWIVINCEFLFQTNLTSLEGLSKFIDPSQLTPDLEGGLSYDHGIWIELRCVSIAFKTNRKALYVLFPSWKCDKNIVILPSAISAVSHGNIKPAALQPADLLRLGVIK